MAGDQIQFDERMAAGLEVMYRTRDVRRRRELVLAALDAQPGDRVLDVGCGPGFYVADIAERVGPSGAVTGIDPSPAMLAMTARRTEGAANVTLAEGGADGIPVADAAFDRAVSVQVLEYVADVPGALAELRRLLRPGGRLVLWDVDWTTLSWHAVDADRMARMLTAWDRHLVDPALPRTLAAALREAGFEDVRREGHLFATAAMDPETYGGSLPNVIASYLRGLDDVDDAEVEAWQAELAELDAAGRYSCSVVQFCFVATAP